MWIVILIIGIIVIIIYNGNAHKKEMNKLRANQGTPELTPGAKQIMSEFHKDLSKPQRYAYYNLLSTIAETHVNSPTITKNRVQYTLRQTVQFLDISADQADNYLFVNGVSELCEQLGSIPKGAQLDSILSTAFAIASAAEGSIKGMQANEYAIMLLIKICNEAGISENDLYSSIEKSAMFTKQFMSNGRNF